MAGSQAAKLSHIKVVPPSEASEKHLPPVLLIHGLAQTKERWKESLQALANDTHRTVYAVDLRNHGDSDQTDSFDFQLLVSDLDNFLSEQEISQVSIIGHSVGAIVAMNLALQEKTKVEKIVLEDMSPVKFVPELSVILSEMLREQHECLKLLPPNSEEDFVHRALKECIYRTIPMISDEDREILEKMEFPIRKTENGFEYKGNLPVLCKALQDPESLGQEYCGRFDGEALFIYGGSSSMRVSDDKEVIRSHFPNCSFSCFPNAGHEVFKYNPQEFMRIVTEFLKS